MIRTGIAADEMLNPIISGGNMHSQKSITVFTTVLFVLSCLSGAALSFDKDAADRQWDAVRGTEQESSFLIGLFIAERMPGDYPHNVRERFGEIADRSDAVYLLDKLIDPSLKKQHTAVYTLLKELSDDEIVPLFEEYFFRSSDKNTRDRLINLISKKNSITSYNTAGRCLEGLNKAGNQDEAVMYLNYMVRFNQPDIRGAVIAAVSSKSSMIKAASYVALRNYPDAEVLTIIQNALLEVTKELSSESKLSVPNLQLEQSTLYRDILENSQKVILQNQLNYNNSQKPLESAAALSIQDYTLTSEPEGADYLAREFAPVLYLSSEGGGGVNLRDGDENFPYQDYIPISVYDMTSHPTNKAVLVTNFAEQTIVTDTIIDSLGTYLVNGFLSFAPLWGDSDVVSAYKQLQLTPTVYYRIFRDSTQKNPVAIQYWFHYFFNDWTWFGDHPGDWESITVFLNSKTEGTEVIYSTHYEANRSSWAYVDTVKSTHPSVYVSNGGHGSYPVSGNTCYGVCFGDETGGLLDNHLGDREVLYPSFLEYNGTPYTLVRLPDEESSWPKFEGRWGDQDSAPPGPLFRFDAPSYGVCPSYFPIFDPKGNDGWECANNKPYDPYNNCAERRDTRIAGDDEHYGPWYWAAGYGLDGADCVPITDFSWNLFLPAILAGASGDTIPTVTSLTGRVWMDRNIGASQVATSSTDELAYGDLYQWGRLTDGHEKRNSNTLMIVSSTDAPGHDNFITTTSQPFDWRNPQNDNLWQGGYGLNNPCPTNFRLPTADEWQDEMDSWSSKDAAGAFSSPLKLVMPGQRLYPSGSTSETGLRGAYWSSTIDSDSSNNSIKYLLVKSDSGTIYTNPRAYGMSVRCIKDEPELVSTVTSATGQVWMDRNLGASRVATSPTDEEAYGYLYQWGRGKDGHEKRTSGTTTTLSPTDVPGHGNFITTPSNINNIAGDWRSSQNDNLWQGMNGVNNPCPLGFRLPRQEELEEERLSWSSNDIAGAFASPLKFPAAGYRNYDGSFNSEGIAGLYWTSSFHGTDGINMAILSAGAHVDGWNGRSRGFSVRCIQD